MERSYHLIITNFEDFKIDKNNNFKVIGFPERNKKTVMNFNIGDYIVYYVTKKSSFCAIVEVTSRYFYSREKIWSDYYDLWSHRVFTKPVIQLKSDLDSVYIKDIWENLDFIKNHYKWGSSVMGSYKHLSEHDFKIIYNEMIKRNRRDIL